MNKKQKNNRWSQSVELSKQDLLWHDAIETAAESKDNAIAEELLKYFVEKKLKVHYNHISLNSTLTQ